MDSGDACTSYSPWRRHLGDLNHVRVVVGWLASWDRRHVLSSDGASSRSEALDLVAQLEKQINGFNYIILMSHYY
jgi:hypothetical protein